MPCVECNEVLVARLQVQQPWLCLWDAPGTTLTQSEAELLRNQHPHLVQLWLNVPAGAHSSHTCSAQQASALMRLANACSENSLGEHKGILKQRRSRSNRAPKAALNRQRHLRRHRRQHPLARL